MSFAYYLFLSFKICRLQILPAIYLLYLVMAISWNMSSHIINNLIEKCNLLVYLYYYFSLLLYSVRRCYKMHCSVYNSTPLVPIQILMSPLRPIFVRLASIGLLITHILLRIPLQVFLQNSYRHFISVPYLKYTTLISFFLIWVF